MNPKLVGAAVLVVFFFVQLGSSLECWSCDSPDACKSPSKIKCDHANANKTTAHLQKYFQGVPSLVSSDYDCLFQNYTMNNKLNMTYKGCLHRSIKACSNVYPLNATLNLQKGSCLACSGHLCNPAGTFSSSAFTIILAAIFGLVLTKMLRK